MKFCVRQQSLRFLLMMFVCKQVTEYTNIVFVKHDTYFKPVSPALNVGKH